MIAYGITPEEYAQKLEAQKGICAICGKPETRIIYGKVTQLCVDHDHTTNAVRDLLCYRCNSVLGFVKEDHTMLKKCTEYLAAHNEQKETEIG